MSKFNNQRAFAGPPQLLDPPIGTVPEAALAEPLEISPPDARLQPAELTVSSFQRLGFLLLCTYLLSGYANELTIRFFHGKAWLSTITEVVLPFVLLVSGS